MANEEKRAVLGKTVYLQEGESFDKVKDPVLPKKVAKEMEAAVLDAKEKAFGNDDVADLASDFLSRAKDEKDESFYSEGEVEIEDELPENEIEEISKEEVKEKVRKKAKVVDLSQLTVVNRNEIEKERDLTRALYGGKSAYQIVAAQSGYMAKVLPLVHKDQVNLYFSNLSLYEYKKNVYKVIWEKIHDTSVGKMPWEDWLKNTTVEDLETFFYGVYASTFPNEGSFSYTCPKCGEQHDYGVNHNNLIKTTDKDKMKLLIDNVSKNATTVEKMKEYSLIGKNEAIELSHSGIIVELRTPTLFDSLEILRTVPEKTINKDTLSITNMLYINKILIPSKDDNGIYAEETKKTTILRVIDSMPIDDANELQTAVLDRVDENRITYSIKNIKCTDCAHEVNDIPLSIEDVLFTLIFEKTQ
jgi:hypothetical protein